MSIYGPSLSSMVGPTNGAALARILALQRAAGNQAVGAFIQRGQAETVARKQQIASTPVEASAPPAPRTLPAPPPKPVAAVPTASQKALPSFEAPAQVPQVTARQARLAVNPVAPDIPEPAAVAPAPIAATGAVAAGGGVIDPEAARSKIDFSTWTLDDYLNGFRVAGELSRVVPGVGLFTGVAADAVGGYQDVLAIPKGSGTITEGLIILRGVVNAINSAVGHVKYVTELIQDGLISSAIGSAALPISAAAINVESGLKIYLDLSVQVIDSAVLVGAAQNQSLSDPKSPEFGQWQKLIDGYQANLIGDIVGTVLDFVGMLSAGTANEGPIGQGARVLSTIGLLLRNHRQVLVSWAQGIFNVLGSGLPGIEGEQIPVKRKPGPSVPPAGSSQGAVSNAIVGPGGGSAAQSTALLATAGVVSEETASARVAWQTIDLGLGVLKKQSDQQMAELDAVVKRLSGGKGLFAVIRDSGLKAIGNLRARVDKITQFEPMAAEGRKKAEKVRDGAAGVLGTIDAFTVPDITIPRAKVGDGILAGAAEAVVNTASDAVNTQLKALIRRLQQSVDTARSEARKPVVGARDKAVEFINVIDIAEKVALTQKAAMSKYADNFERGLAKCHGFEDAVDLMIVQIAAATGLTPFTVQEVRDGWASIPAELDRLDILAAGLRKRAAALAHEEEEDSAGAAVASNMPPSP